MRVVKLTLFKPSGKYYTEKSVNIPEHTPIFDIPNYINGYLCGKFKEMHVVITGEFEGMYPMMIPSNLRV